ncbi:MAG: gluzincin family metallopeptidase, partial [Thermomicrobiales bacterium]
MTRALLLALFALLLSVPGVAADTSSFLTAPGGPWQHDDTTYFSINYIARDPVAPQADIYKTIADPVYDMETNIFDGSRLVPQPVPIYLYTDVAQFITVVPAAQEDQNLYSGMDSGGIYVLVPRMSGLKAPELTLNLRMLLTRQIAAMMSGGNLPVGLLEGTALYGEAPPAELSALVATIGQQANADRLADWGTLFTSADNALVGQQYSVVSFLIDTYGFRQFRDFLTTLSKPEAGKDWRQAMQIVYKNEGNAAATTLESKWKAYLPQFLGGLWQRNQFTYYNIDVATQLVGIGQYSQAVTLLTPAIGFLQQTGTPKRAADAQALLSKARAGSEAETRVRDAQQALEANDYTRTNELLKQAAD